MNALSFATQYLEKSLETLRTISAQEVSAMIGLIAQARENGNQVFICGNGGSAATASHLANDLGKGASIRGPKRFRVMSLTDNFPWISALANDLDYSAVFVEQLKNFGQPGDLLIAISGSGNSENVLAAVQWANENALITLGLTGKPGGKLRNLAQHVIAVDSTHMGRIEEAHFLIQHLVGYYFMNDLG